MHTHTDECTTIAKYVQCAFLHQASFHATTATEYDFSKPENESWEFPGLLCFQCQGPGFDSWSGN